MITYLKTKNFRKLGNAEFSFTDDLNIICGPNAAGKTTILQAMMFALYGVKAVPVKADKIPTWGEKDCEVRLGLAGDIEILRTLKACKVFKGDHMVASGNSACANYIQKEITGVDLNGFKMLNWSAQGETSALLTIGAAQLQRDVEKHSGVGYIDQIIKLAGTDQRDKQRDVDLTEFEHTEEELKVWIEQSIDTKNKLEVRRQSLVEQEASLSQEKDTVSEKLAESQKTLKLANQIKEDIAQHQERLIQATSKVEALEERIDEKSAEFSKLNPLSNEEFEDKKVRMQALKDASLRVSHTRLALASAEETLSEAEEGITSDRRLEAEVSRARAEHEACKEPYEGARQKASDLRREGKRLRKILDDGVCELCGSVLTDEEQLQSHRIELAAVEEQLITAQDREVELLQKLEAAEVEFSKANKNYKSGYQNWAARQAEAEERAASLQESLLEEESKLPGEGELEKLESEVHNAEATRLRFSELGESLAELKHSENVARVQITKLEAAVENLREALPVEVLDQEEISALQGQLSKLQESLTHCVRELGGVQAQIVTEERKIKDGESQLERRKACDETVKEIALLEEFIKYLRESRVHFISSVWTHILGNASAFLEQTTAGSITSLVKSDAEGFMFCEDGVFAPVAAASGAQRAFIGVAVRLALAQSLRASCPVVVFDEPSESMREENALRLSGGLLGRGQVIMVTHREADRMTAANTIEL